MHMRSCLGIILLIILVAVIAVTAFFLWESNARIEFTVRKEGDPEYHNSVKDIQEIAPKKEKEPPPVIEKDAMKMEVAVETPPAPENEVPKQEPAENTQESEEIPVAEPVE